MAVATCRWHGRSPTEPTASPSTTAATATTRLPGAPISWERYGDDAEAVADTLDTPVAAFGHSMGGACLLMAAHRNPSLFHHLVLFEPIVYPQDRERPTSGRTPWSRGSPPSRGVPLVRTRRSPTTPRSFFFFFFSPLNAFAPEALDAYVRFGFAEGEDGMVSLKCRPETEAGTFELGGHPPHLGPPRRDRDARTRRRLGVVQEMQPSSIAAQVAEQLPNGRYLQLDHLDHFGPMTHPAEVAALVADTVF